MVLCLISMSAWANKTVTGKVVSASDNEPLIGATVQAIGSSQGTSTDLDGQFTVTVNDNVTQLRVSCVGYKSQVVPVSSYVTVALEDANTTLDEVVVTAMGIKREAKALGVSATPIKGDVIAQARQVGYHPWCELPLGQQPAAVCSGWCALEQLGNLQQ